MTLRVVSHGGGVQSTALLVLAARRVIDFPTFLFSNVGDDSEEPETLVYFHEVAVPYAEANGIAIHELRRVDRQKRERSLYADLVREESRSIEIPVRMANGAPGNRSCTATYKIKVIDRWLAEHGATKAAPATVAVGFSTDEIERLSTVRRSDVSVPTHPLIDLRMNRADCAQVIRDAGLPIPPKSSCWFCPFQKPSRWQRRAEEQPDIFWKSVELERTLNHRRDKLGKDHVFFTRFGRPLDEVVDGNQQAFDLDGPEGCDDGYCWT